MSDVTPIDSANKGPTPRPVLERQPESFRPDRNETDTFVGLGTTDRIDHGVNFECLVGKFNRARDLTTGLVTIDPGGKLPDGLQSRWSRWRQLDRGFQQRRLARPAHSLVEQAVANRHAQQSPETCSYAPQLATHRAAIAD